MLRNLILLSVGGFVIIVGGLTTLLVVLVAMGGEDYGTRLEFNGGELFYTDAVQKSEAQALGEFLVDEVEFFDGDSKSVQLDRQNGTFVVRFCVYEGAWEDAGILAAYSQLQAALSNDVFDGEMVEIHLCDDVMDTQHMISAGDENSLADLTVVSGKNG